MKNIILYVEDDSMACFYAKKFLMLGFPDYRIEIHERVSQGIKAVSDCIDDIAMVCTDGKICDSTGWELAQELKNLGYDGPILYTGFTDIPEKHQHLFNDLAGKAGADLTDQINKYI